MSRAYTVQTWLTKGVRVRDARTRLFDRRGVIVERKTRRGPVTGRVMLDSCATVLWDDGSEQLCLVADLRKETR